MRTSPRPSRPAPGGTRRACTRWIAWLAGVLVLGVAGTASAEPPPPAFLQMEVTDEVTVVEISAQVELMRAWTGLDAPNLDAPGPIPRPFVRQLFEALAPAIQVRVDGASRPPTVVGGRVERFEDGAEVWPYARIKVQVPTAVPPRQVELVWQRYGEETTFSFDAIGLELEAYDDLRELRADQGQHH